MFGPQIPNTAIVHKTTRTTVGDFVSQSQRPLLITALVFFLIYIILHPLLPMNAHCKGTLAQKQVSVQADFDHSLYTSK